MRRSVFIFVMLILIFSLCPLFSQEANTLLPIVGMEEFVYHNLPVGGWNILGSFSPRSTAMGETLLANSNPMAGYLNPSMLTFLSCPQFSLNYRFSKNTYKTYLQNPLVNLVDFDSQTLAFSRNTDYLDSVGIAFPFREWVIAANYFLFQEFNFPAVKAASYSSQGKVKQSGEMKGFSFAVSHCLTRSFSIGVSATYIFGEASRFQVSSPIYMNMDWDHFIQDFHQGRLFILQRFPYSLIIENYELDLKGVFFNVGFYFKLNRKWLLGFALRPAFKINLKTQVEYVFPEIKKQRETFSGDFYFKQPLVVVTSVLYRPIRSFELTADFSYWAWSNATTDYKPSWYYPYNFRNIFSLKAGAEYRIEFPFRFLKGLSLRTGYIYDPQPYQYNESFAHDFLCAGICVKFGHFDIESAVKINIAPAEQQRFHANLLQIGISCRL